MAKNSLEKDEVKATAVPFACANCKFAVPSESGYLDCRRFPPSVTEAKTAEFPQVKHYFWCGEFEMRDNPTHEVFKIEVQPGAIRSEEDVKFLMKVMAGKAEGFCEGIKAIKILDTSKESS